MKFAMVFPGQGSQSVGMLADLASSHAVVQTTFAEASDVLGYDLWALIQNGSDAELGRTEITQPAMLVAGVAVWRAWQAAGGPAPAVLAGHSLGEYTALVAAEAIVFADAVGVVQERARLMQSAVPQGQGAMAAILGLDDDAVRRVCAEAAQGDVVSAVNFNAPGQVVIAGSTRAVERAVVAAKESGAKRALPLPVSVPSHCALMESAAEKLAQRLAEVDLKIPAVALLHNVNVAAAKDVTEMRQLLAQQLFSPVRWVETVTAIAATGIETVIECGPGKVLAGLTKRIDRQLNSLAIFDGSSVAAAIESVAGDTA